jgi:hypothetical protein
MEVLIMSASAHRYTCDELAACQSRPTPCTSCTPDPYLLNTARLHRVDASLLPKDTGVSLGHCRTDLPAHRVISMKPDHACAPLRCMGDPACPDHNCESHPRNAAREDERDARLARWVWGTYAAIVVVSVVLYLTY